MNASLDILKEKTLCLLRNLVGQIRDCPWKQLYKFGKGHTSKLLTNDLGGSYLLVTIG